jgi:GTP diphosphokinase / guanosine-3',5'-bis(diphosphate) 3'-diphosphatase
MTTDQDRKQFLHLPLLGRAGAFAAHAHSGQTRSDGSPYIEHPCRLAGLLVRHGVTDEEILAMAYLHDTVEDCDVSEDEIKEFFGERVARGVMQLTNKIEGESHERKFGRVSFVAKHNALLEHCRRMDLDVKWVKLADRLDNLQDSLGHWKPKRIKRYAKAGYELVQALMPWPKGSETLACQLVSIIYDIIPPEEIANYQIVDDVRE